MSSAQKPNNKPHFLTAHSLCRPIAKGHGAMHTSRHRSLYCVGGILFASIFGMFYHLQPMELTQKSPSLTSISFRQIEAESLPDIEQIPEILPEPATHKLMADASDFTLQEPEPKPKPEPQPAPKPKPKPDPKPKPKPDPKPKPKPDPKPKPKPDLATPEPQVTQADVPQELPVLTTAATAAPNPQSSKHAAEQERLTQNHVFNALLKEIERRKSYPKAARRNKTEGTVYLVVELDAKGKVVAASVPANASSPPLLAKATQQLGDTLRGFVVEHTLGKALTLRIPIEYSLR